MEAFDERRSIEKKNERKEKDNGGVGGSRDRY